MIIALTGGVGCGKSTVAQEFASLGWTVLDADRICHDIYENRCEDLRDIFEERWGEGCAGVRGTSIDRGRIAEIVFSDSEELQWLNGVFHPLVREFGMREAVDSTYVLFDIPLLYEVGWDEDFECVIGVWSSAEIQRKRLLGRGWSNDECERRISSQMSADQKLERADYGLINNADMNTIRQQCIDLDKQLRMM